MIEGFEWLNRESNPERLEDFNPDFGGLRFA